MTTNTSQNKVNDYRTHILTSPKDRTDKIPTLSKKFEDTEIHGL